MSSTVEISVAILCYNQRRFLRERINSVLSQTLPPEEIVFLDDASTDGSAAAAAELFSNCRARVIANVHNQGVFAQWKRAVRETRGRYLWIAEGDDYASPDLLLRLKQLMDAHPRIGIAYANSQIIDADGRFLSPSPPYLGAIDPERWQADFVADGRDELAQYMVLRNTIPNASACLFRREALEGWVLDDIPFSLCGDWLVYSRILTSWDIGYLSDSLNSYRVHPNTVRTFSDHDGTRIEETYRMQMEIVGQVNVPALQRERAALYSFAELQHWIKQGGRFSMRSLFVDKVVTSARAFDPRFDERVSEAAKFALPYIEFASRSFGRWPIGRSSYLAFPPGKRVQIPLMISSASAKFRVVSPSRVRIAFDRGNDLEAMGEATYEGWQSPDEARHWKNIPRCSGKDLALRLILETALN